ncbi:hypothetical protein [Clostridium phage vB_CpeP_PMQ04]|nr:hypothetical protein [Clostridium phage vB_CpeP_PMQ04]
MEKKTIYLKVDIIGGEEELLENPMRYLSVDFDADYCYLDYEIIKEKGEE